jgi:C-terminal processing protease CtpA/Prc
MEEPARIDGSGDWPGPLVVLTDAGTASSAEDFAAWIRDNGAGTLVGARTAGAGCGYVNGGTRTRLTVLPLDVRMPNCARFLRDGNNEMEGVPPHVAIPMGEPEQAVAALARFLGT